MIVHVHIKFLVWTCFNDLQVWNNTISYSYLRSFCPSRTFFNIIYNRHHFQHEDFTQTISSCQRQTRFLSHPHRAFPFLATCRPHVAGAWGPWQGMWPGINSTNEWVGLLVDAVDSGNVLKRMPNVFCHQDHQDKEDKKKARRKHKVPCLNDIRAIRGAGLCKDVRHLVIWRGCLGACFFSCVKWSEENLKREQRKDDGKREKKRKSGSDGSDRERGDPKRQKEDDSEILCSREMWCSTKESTESTSREKA